MDNKKGDCANSLLRLRDKGHGPGTYVPDS